MITKNFKSLLAMTLQSSSSIYGVTQIIGVDGTVYYCPGKFEFPYSITASASLSATSAGISVGTGNTTPKENDYNLENTITSGITMTITDTLQGYDSYGNPYIQYNITIANNGSDAITISEICYKQTLKGVRTPSDTTSSNVICMLDRTVFSTPITIEADDAGVITYQMKTNIFEGEIVSGIEIVPFEFGTDEQITAIIEAARQGIIDLQEDAGWRIGDVRTIQIGAFSSPNVSHAAQTIYLIISSFEEYEGCSNVMQLDFYNCLAPGNRINSSNTNVGGYGSSEMYTSTMPALEAALPSWLRGLLKTFSVKSSLGNKSTEIGTVTNNKVALRCATEIFENPSNVVAGEGEQVELYEKQEYQTKLSGTVIWTRSPLTNSTNGFFAQRISGSGTTSSGATAANYIAPFCCV